jgi:hypothetical protein
MKRIGNAESNKTYNPRNTKAQIPIDIDEVDGAMERYIRQKYEQRIYMTAPQPGTRHNTGSTSSEDRPPPLPPKPTGRFGFGLRKASASRNLSPPTSPGLGFGQETSPPRVNKPSRVFGSNIQTSGDGMDSKLATLRDMGFPDDKRNSTVLKGLNGNLDRTVEALIRLGEQNSGKSGRTTPTPPAKNGANGLSFDNVPQTTSASTNPFDALDAAPLAQQQQPQNQQFNYGGQQQQASQQSNSYNPFMSQGQQGQYPQQGGMQQSQNYSQQGQYQQQQQQQPQQQQNYGQSYNPFGQQPQQQQQQQQQSQQSLEQSFQGMQLSQQPQQYQQAQQPAQPLFPNRTGGLGQPNPSFAQTNPFQQSFTPPPMPQIPEQYSSFQPPQPQYQSMSQPASPGNPFLKSSRSQIFTPSANSNPFGPSLLQQQAQQPQQQQASQQQAFNPWMTQQQTQTPTAQAPNPFNSMGSSYQQTQTPTAQAPNPWQYQQQPAQQHSYPQNNAPFDKYAAFSLYGQQQSAPQRSATMPNLLMQAEAGAQAQAQAPAAPAASNTLSFSGHSNPFGSAAPTPAAPHAKPLSALAQNQGTRHVSNESVDFTGLMGGRHSPDAFGSLSSSFRR